MLIITIAFLLGVASVKISPVSVSTFEMTRRVSEGDEKAKAELAKSNAYIDLVSLQRVVVSLFLVIATVLLVVVFGWVIGVLAGVVLALEYGALARIPLFNKIVQPWYEKIEPKLITLCVRYPRVLSLLRTITVNESVPAVASREEFVHIVKESNTVFSHDEKNLLIATLGFKDKLVKEIMTPRSVIDSVKKSELLGPFVLNDLHKTGHSRLPVVDGDIDHIVGILHLRDLLTVDTSKKHTSKVDSVMESKVYYIRDEQTLQHALAAFLRTRHHLFVVVNNYRETVGLLSLEDVVEALLGRAIVDEYDTHEDLRAVAARNPRANNEPKMAKNI